MIQERIEVAVCPACKVPDRVTLGAKWRRCHSCRRRSVRMGEAWALDSEDLSLHETLAVFGLEARKQPNTLRPYARDVVEVETGEILTAGRAHDVWTWLRATGRTA